VLYIGVMLTAEGPRVLEFNCRFGDPETQPTMLRLSTDLLDVIDAIDEDRLAEIELVWDPSPALCVVLAAEGYPTKPRIGEAITGALDSSPGDDVQVFHGATRRDGDRLVTAGGRVLSVVARGRDLPEARRRAYERADRIRFAGATRRSDIGGAER
jgi:phosphoribosylamine--glycine ligase